jgi:hypothetical protein
MSFLTNIFGSEKVINGAIDGIDAMFYTDEEKAQQKIALLEAYQPFKLIQRVLAFFVAFLFSIVFIIEMVLVILSMWFPSTLETVSVINSLEIVSMLGWAFISVMSLYFTGGVFNVFANKKK